MPHPPRLYAKRFSLVGIVCVGITILLVIGTVLLMNWDTVVKGEDEENIGELQNTAIYVAMAGVIVFIIIALIDAHRTRTASRV